MERGMKGCLTPVNLLHLSLQPALLPSWGSETALPEVIPQPLAGLTLNWKQVKMHGVGKILNISSLEAMKKTQQTTAPINQVIHKYISTGQTKKKKTKQLCGGEN